LIATGKARSGLAKSRFDPKFPTLGTHQPAELCSRFLDGEIVALGITAVSLAAEYWFVLNNRESQHVFCYDLIDRDIINRELNASVGDGKQIVEKCRYLIEAVFIGIPSRILARIMNS